MAITFLQKKKIQRLLLLLFVAAILVTAGVVWWGFFQRAPLPAGELPGQKRVQVDTSVLSNPVLKELEQPRAPVQIPSDIGRVNPFAR